MRELVTSEANTTATPTSQQPRDDVAYLKERIAYQLALLNQAASIMLEACISDDGINTSKAEGCIDSIRGEHYEFGKNTAEELLQQLYDRIGAAAGFPPGTEFNPIQVLQQMQMTMAVQARNGLYLELLLAFVLIKGSETQRPRLQVSPAGAPLEYRWFPIGTDWPVMLDTMIAERTAALVA